MKKIITLSLVSILLLACDSNPKSNATSEDTVSNVDIIKGLYTSLEQGQIEAFTAALDNEIVWNEAENYPYDDGNPYIGPQAVMSGIMGRVASEWDDFSVDNRKFYAMENDMVLVTGRYTATYKATGKSLNAQVAHHWTLKDGKVIGFQQYTDTKQAHDVISE